MHAENYISNWQDVVSHILSCYPEEGGGIVTSDNIFHPITNVSDTPLGAFEFHPRELIGKDVKCILHSHPYDQYAPPGDDPRIPSKCDMESQIATDVEWAIVVTEGENVTQPVFWGDYTHRPPLFNREFIHNIQDCVSFMYDWQYEKFGLELPFFPRDFDWTENGEDCLEVFYPQAGFVDVSHLPPVVGDVIFYKIQCDKSNHVGVVIDENTVAHQLFGRFPKTEPMEKWQRYISRRIRHSSNPLFNSAK